MSSRLFRSFRHAFRGLRTALKTEKNFRIHVAITILVIILAWYKDIGRISWVVLLLVMALVMALEIFNSAIERLVDMLAPKTHSFAKEIKDLLAAMVLIVSLFAVAIGLIIFLR
ncbi:diacylglycerol kinase family protein [Candidatus Parcubacteria bacterium]|jgi:undecaprenol kinase|nr:diacylglycerol kinase family protein [Candidatus Parcubacteria bacterium]